MFSNGPYYANWAMYFTKPVEGFQEFEYIRSRMGKEFRVKIWTTNRATFNYMLTYWNDLAKDSGSGWKYTASNS